MDPRIFTWSMAKLKLFMDNAFGNHTIPTQLNKLFNSVNNRDNKYFYKGITLTRFELVISLQVQGSN